MKKSLLALIAIALFLAVASGGCGGGGSKVDTADDAAPVDTPDATSTNVIIEESGDYTVSYMALYGCNESLDWNLLWDSEGALENDTTAFNVSADYIMYGFEFDINDDDSNWAYSGIFWSDGSLIDYDIEASASQGKSPSEIRINLAGTESAPQLKIGVDGKTTTYNCSDDKTRHDWNTKAQKISSEIISVHIDTASAYYAREMSFYGRTAGGKWKTLALYIGGR